MRVLFVFPALVILFAIVMMAFGINGWSSGEYRGQVTGSHDPQLLVGEPRDIRTDEWFVQTPWAIAQIQQGLPVENRTFPYGMDATVPQDLPRADWTVAFRPHLLGFLVLDAGRAFAEKWWALAVGLLLAAFWFLVTLLPRRPIVAALLSLGFVFSPLFQWWYLATTIWPAVWALFTITAVEWAFRSGGRRVRWAMAGGVGYLTVVMAMGIYVPYILPAVLLVIAYLVGRTAVAVGPGLRFRSAVTRLLPLAVAAVIAAVILVVWLATRAKTVEAFLSTSYPGNRLTPTGDGNLVGFMATIASSFSQALGAGGLLGQNSSEASSFFLVGLFLAPVAIWLCVTSFRARAARPWQLVAVLVVVVVFVAFLYVPGWDVLAHLLFLDRSTPNRIRLGVGLASLVILALLVERLDRRDIRVPVALVWICAGGYVLSQLVIALAIAKVVPKELAVTPQWWVFAIVGGVTIWLFARSHLALGAVAFAGVTLAAGIWVNPVYIGVYDLRTTPVAKGVEAVESQKAGVWVGVGGRLTTGVLLETGVEAYNGFQGAPSRAMWKTIDPASTYEFQWNRLAGLGWAAGHGEPTVSNPAPDQILATFDSCSTFAQKHVDYVLSDRHAIATQPCLKAVGSYPEKAGELTIYRVVSG